MAVGNEQERELAAGSGGMPATSDYGARSHPPGPGGYSPSDQGSSAPPSEASANPPSAPSDMNPQPAGGEDSSASNDTGTGSDMASGGTPPANAGGAEGSSGESGTTPDTSGADTDTGATLQPVLDTVDGTMSDLTGGTSALGDATDVLNGLPVASGLASGLTGIIDSAGVDTGGITGLDTGALSGLVNEVASLPDTLLSGGAVDGVVNGVTGLLDSTLNSTLGLDTPLGTGLLSPVSNLLGDVGDSLQSLPLVDVAGGALGSATAGNPNDTGITGLLDSSLGSESILSPVSNLVSDVDHGLQALPLVNLNGGDVGTASVGDLNGSSSASLVDIGAGQSADGIGIGLLSTADSDSHLLDVNALGVGSGGPQLVSADLVPALNGDAVAPLLNGLDLSDLGTTAGPLLSVHSAASDATIGDLGSSSSGHLLDISAGPQDANGLGIDALATPSSDGHTVDIGAVDTGSDGPQLADASLLNDAGLPSLNGVEIPSLGSATGLIDTDSSLVTLNGGNNADDGGIAGGTIGNLVTSSTGHLIDADVGPSQNGTGVDLLAAPMPADHAVSANAVDVGSDGPQLADLGLLTTDQAPINIPAPGGSGLDSLAGNLLGGTEATSSSAEAAPAPAPTETAHVQDLLPVGVTGDHGIVDVLGHQVI